MAVLMCWVHNAFSISFYMYVCMYRQEVGLNLSACFLQNVPIPVRVDSIRWLVCLLRSSKLFVHLREVGWERDSV